MSTLFFGGDVVPMTGERDRAEALLASDDGRIAFVGTLEGARAAAGRLGEPIRERDLAGAALLPSLIDPYGHISSTSQYFVACDLHEAKSFEDIVRLLAAFVHERGITAEGAVLGVGYDQNELAEGRNPDRHVLDRVPAEAPVIAVHASGHVLAASTRALELAGVDAQTPDPEGGRYEREADGRTPTGYVEEPHAMAPIYRILAGRVDSRIEPYLAQIQDLYLSHGITTVQDGAESPEEAEALAGLAGAGRLKLDVVGYLTCGGDIDGFLSAHPGVDLPVAADARPGTRRFRVGGFKMFLDGSPQARTAWMSEPYTPGPEGSGYRGFPTMSDEAAYAFARKAIDSGHQLLTHCNGDAASEQLLRVYGRALRDSPNPLKGSLRPVMIHCQTARRDQFARMGALNMVPSIFVSHCWYWGDVHLKNFGPERGGRISAVHDALDYGLPYTFHTDTPVVRPDLLEAVWCAARRVTKRGQQLDEDQRVSVYQGLEAVTSHVAYQYGEEARKGTLEAGKLADLVVLERNPLGIPVDDVRRLRVLETYKEGRLVWSPDGPNV